MPVDMSTFLPERVSMQDDATLRTIRFRWHWTHSKWRLILAAALPLGVIIGWKNPASLNTALWIASLIALGVLYIALAGWCNSTTFSVKQSKLTVRHHPMPWFGGLSIPANSLRDIEVEEYESRTKYGPHIKYRLIGRTLSGQTIRLASVFDTQDKAAAQFVCDCLESWSIRQ